MNSPPLPSPWTAAWTPASALDAVLGPLLVAAGDEALRRFRRARPSRKADGSLVTEADRAAEAVLVEGLSAAFPGDAIEAEEGRSVPGGARRWAVDPLDGTSAFVEGLAHWGPTVGLLDGRQVIAGAFWMPRLSEYYFFERGLGAFRDGEPLPRRAPDAELPRGAVLFIPSRLHAGARLDWPGKARCLGSVAAHLALVAAGGAEAALIPPGWHLWDTVAGLGLIDATGGVAALPDGAPLDPVAHQGRAFVAGSPAAVRWLLTPGRLVAARPELMRVPAPPQGPEQRKA